MQETTEEPRDPTGRRLWQSQGPLGVVRDEPLFVSLLRYRKPKDVLPAEDGDLVSSNVGGTRHLPIIDLDYPHQLVDSSTQAHGHLFLNKHELNYFQWLVLMIGLRVGKVIEPGFFWWSLRRGGNFVRRQKSKWEQHSG